jgi:hypothetical protein
MLALWFAALATPVRGHASLLSDISDAFLPSFLPGA